MPAGITKQTKGMLTWKLAKEIFQGSLETLSFNKSISFKRRLTLLLFGLFDLPIYLMHIKIIHEIQWISETTIKFQNKTSYVVLAEKDQIFPTNEAKTTLKKKNIKMKILQDVNHRDFFANPISVIKTIEKELD